MTLTKLFTQQLLSHNWRYFMALDLLELGLGVALPGIGGLLGTLGKNMFGEGGTTASQMATQDLAAAAQKLAPLNLYNAAGRTGEAARTSFDTALASLTNSAEARKAYAAQNQLAGQLLAGQQAAMNATNRNAQAVAGAQTRQLSDIARNQGLGAGAVAQLARNIGQGADNTLTAANLQNAQSANQAIGQAGQMMGSAAEGLAKDLATRNDIFVRPFYAQSSGMGNQALAAFPGMKQVQEQQKIMENPLFGFGVAMGGLGKDLTTKAFADTGSARGQQIIKTQGGGY